MYRIFYARLWQNSHEQLQNCSVYSKIPTGVLVQCIMERLRTRFLTTGSLDTHLIHETALRGHFLGKSHCYVREGGGGGGLGP